MNKENVLAVADAIEQHSIPELGFNMLDFGAYGLSDNSGHNCETTACIGGWACLLAAPGTDVHSACAGPAQDWLELSGEQANDLFYMDNAPALYLSDVTSSQAVRVLRHLAETGKVDWSIAQPESQS